MSPKRGILQAILALTISLALPTSGRASEQGIAPAGEADQERAKPSAEDLDRDDQQQEPAWMKIWKRVKFGTVWYLHYGFGEQDAEPFNRARIGRGYVTFKAKPVKWFKSRVTLDTHQDDEGDFKLRLKYMYGEFVLPIETFLVTEPAIEFGLVHGPWFDFEEDINHYRAQGTMFIERNKVLNSADAGVTAKVLLGRKLPREYQDTVSDAYPGTWGSVAFGVYNGGGYHAQEQNQNKVFASRVSLRPAGPWLPNLQLSHFFIYGKGNTDREPAYKLNGFMGSFEHEYFTLSGQYSFGEGNQKGDKVDAEGKALPHKGWSLFGEIKLPWISWRVIGRYDNWEWDGDRTRRMIAGLVFYFYKYNFIMVDYDRLIHDTTGLPADYEAKLSLQVHY